MWLKSAGVTNSGRTVNRFFMLKCYTKDENAPINNTNAATIVSRLKFGVYILINFGY